MTSTIMRKKSWYALLLVFALLVAGCAQEGTDDTEATTATTADAGEVEEPRPIPGSVRSTRRDQWGEAVDAVMAASRDAGILLRYFGGDLGNCVRI